MKKRNGWKWSLAATIWFALSTATALSAVQYDTFARWPYAAGLTVAFGVLTAYLLSKAKKERQEYAALMLQKQEALEKEQKERQEALEKEQKERQEEIARAEAEAKEKRELAIQEEQRRREAAAKAMAEAEEKQSLFLASIPESAVEVSDTPAKKLAAAWVSDLQFSSVTSRSTLDRLCDFVAIDVETTGLSPSNSEIIEIAAIKFRGFEPVMKFQSLCNPLRGTTAESESINGITEEMLEDQPNFQKIAGSLREFIGDDNIVGHNLEFDLKFIVKYGVDLSEDKRKYFDTLRISQRILKKPQDVYDYKLQTLSSYYGIPLFGAHRALADCYAAGRLLECLAREVVDQ